jgi:hypothetical protein
MMHLPCFRQANVTLAPYRYYTRKPVSRIGPKEFDGVKYPTRRVAYRGNEKNREVNLIELKFHHREEPAAFQKP